jgi:hypothetical protein
MSAREIANIVNSLDPVGLDEIDTVRLMNRIDTKFIFSTAKLRGILERINCHYKILEINEVRVFSYLTRYLDTSEYLFFNQHVTGKPERHKVRFRTYETTGTTFLEVKKRTNRNRTIKWRMENDLRSDNNCDDMANRFIKEYIPGEDLVLRPVLTNYFKRITLVEAGFNERVTIDYDLLFSDICGNQAGYPYVAIIELKRNGLVNHSPLASIMKNFSLHPAGFSKYCFGASVLYDIPRKNILKKKQSLINKIENEYYGYFIA